LAINEDVVSIRDSKRGSHVVIGDEDADPLPFEFEQDRLDLFNGNGVDSRERFVQ
jgi:hypothetical protein